MPQRNDELTILIDAPENIRNQIHIPRELYSFGVLNEIIIQINRATQSVFISVYTITHPTIITTLIEKVKTSNIKIEIFVDKKQQKKSEKTCKSNCVEQLRKGGITVYECDVNESDDNNFGKLHTKILIVDPHAEPTAIVGSANFSKTAVTSSIEMGLLIYGPTVTQIYRLMTVFLSPYKSNP